MAGTLSGSAQNDRIDQEGDFPRVDHDLRGLIIRSEYSGSRHLADRTNSSDASQASINVFNQAHDKEETENPSSKKLKMGHPQAEPTANPSHLEQILSRLVPQGLSTMASGKESSATSSNSCMNQAPLLAAPAVAAEVHQSDDNLELQQLKQELLVAKAQLAMQEEELAQNRVIKHTFEQALGSPSEADFGGCEVTDQALTHLQGTPNATTHHGFDQIQNAWNANEDSQSDVALPLSPGAISRATLLWNQTGQLAYPSTQSTCNPASNETTLEKGSGEPQYVSGSTTQPPMQPWNGMTAFPFLVPAQRAPSSSTSAYGFCPHPSDEPPRYSQAVVQVQNPVPRRSFGPQITAGALFPSPANPWSSGSPVSTLESTPKSPIAPSTSSSSSTLTAGYPWGYPGFAPRQSGTRLSPTATEFTTSSQESSAWTGPTSRSTTQTYMLPAEPLNYRRLLDKNVSCDWNFIVDKILWSNDQQASIFLQTKLKAGTTEQKFEIIETIIVRALDLMINRFGNFLVQRCLEHGTTDQVIAIASVFKGRTVMLSKDTFGCHVVQTAFNIVPEDIKAWMVHELLLGIEETIDHRYACHVWQKLFELRWTQTPPPIMARVNETLCGRWHEVALGETGSLVVQNIFENCVEEEKRPAIEEVLAKIDELAYGQFGNWCIQHICEHGAPPDKSRATEHVLLRAADYSTDQYASKIVEKLLKIGGSSFLDDYLARVTTGRPDRPRIPLIDIAGDQYGNYLIQWVIMHSEPHQRRLVESHIRKHMVSLRGSKYGARVAMLCCDPSHTTRPGPGTGMQVGHFNQHNQDRFAPNQGGRGRGQGHQWNSGYPPFH